MQPTNLKHFYIPDDQSVYLLSHKDAKKLKDWFALCEKQLEKLGYYNVKLIGKGAFGFVFAGLSLQGEEKVFKFSKITLPKQVQDRLEEEAYMQSLLCHKCIPKVLAFQKIKRQSILAMQRAPGHDLEVISLQKGPLPLPTIISITLALCDLLLVLRNHQKNKVSRPIVHGDIKPSNVVWDEEKKQLMLIDWGSSVFAQLDHKGQYLSHNVMDLMSSDLQQSNARLGDVYFIGDEQLNGGLSSTRFDEQGLASTIYALASGQSSRFGRFVITPSSLGLPKMLAKCLEAILSPEVKAQKEGGDYLLRNYRHLKNLIVGPQTNDQTNQCFLPTWVSQFKKEIETVVYSSRKSFLRKQVGMEDSELHDVNDAQFERYYKNYMHGMGATEKAFISSVSRLGKYPVVGGLAIKWQEDGIYVDSSLKLYDPTLQYSFNCSVNNMITLARAIKGAGVFKSCMFNAKNTLHIERQSEQDKFIATGELIIPFDKSTASLPEELSRTHSYFEDGDDPDELLQLSDMLVQKLHLLNEIHHTGCIIFEALPKHLKIHNYYSLLDHTKEQEFASLLSDILSLIPSIDGIGISGFMKLPYKDTRYFPFQSKVPTRYYPRNPRT